MKTTMKLALMGALALGAATMTSCKKDDPKEPEVPVYNKFVVNGEAARTTTQGSMMYYGAWFSPTSECVCLELTDGDGDEVLYLEMLVADGQTRLVAGEYTLSDTFAAGTFTNEDEGCHAYDADGDNFMITGGTVKVSVTGTGDAAVYTIAVDCTLTGGGKVKGTYRGTLSWSMSIS